MSPQARNSSTKVLELVDSRAAGSSTTIARLQPPSMAAATSPSDHSDGRERWPEPFTAFQPAQGVQRLPPLIREQNSEIPLVSQGGKGPQNRRRGSYQQLDLNGGHKRRIECIAGVGPLPSNLREGLTTGLQRRLTKPKALQEYLPQLFIAGPHRQHHSPPRATDATGANRLAADQRGCNNIPRQQWPMSPHRLRHGIEGKQPNPRYLGRWVGLVLFCQRGLRPATQLRQPTSQKQASTDANGQSAVFSSSALTPGCCGQESTP